jgi:hypothetical protein
MKARKFSSSLVTIFTSLVILTSHSSVVIAKPLISKLKISSKHRNEIVGTRIRGYLPTSKNHPQTRKTGRGVPAREIFQSVREGKVERQAKLGDDGRHHRIKYTGRNATTVTQNGKIVTTWWNGSSKNQKKKSADRSAAEARPIPFPKKR